MILVSEAFIGVMDFLLEWAGHFFLQKIKQSVFAHSFGAGVSKKYDMIFVKLDVYRHR
jgi:hypothetical protein